MKGKVLFFAIVLGSLFLFGCNKPKTSGSDVNGEDLVKSKGCVVCHSLDGKKIVGPTFKGLYGSKATVVRNGKEETVTVDDKYITESINNPNIAVVKGYSAGQMVLSSKVSGEEIKKIIEFLKTLK